MQWQVIESVWPVLAVLAFLMVTAVLSVLAAQRRHAVALHDRLRESKHRRQEYLATLGHHADDAAEAAG